MLATCNSCGNDRANCKCTISNVIGAVAFVAFYAIIFYAVVALVALVIKALVALVAAFIRGYIELSKRYGHGTALVCYSVLVTLMVIAGGVGWNVCRESLAEYHRESAAKMLPYSESKNSSVTADSRDATSYNRSTQPEVAELEYSPDQSAEDSLSPQPEMSVLESKPSESNEPEGTISDTASYRECDKQTPVVTAIDSKQRASVVKALKKALKHSFHPPRGSRGKQAEISLVVCSDGGISAVKLERSAGVEDFDNACIQAANEIKLPGDISAQWDAPVHFRFALKSGIIGKSIKEVTDEHQFDEQNERDIASEPAQAHDSSGEGTQPNTSSKGAEHERHK